MKKIIIFFSFLFLISCNSQLKLGKYENICCTTDAPNNILFIKKNNRFVLVYPGSVEKLMGEWLIKKDTLSLNLKYQSSLNESDSVSYQGEKFYIIKGRKLINLQNPKCFLRLAK